MSPHGNHKILIIEDEPRIVRLLRVNLESVGYRVIHGLTAGEGLRALGEDAPDLVLLDIMLPDGDGYSLCRRIREFSDVPIIMLTAKTREHDKVEGFHCGADDYVTKPFSSAELLERVKAVLRRSERDSSSRGCATDGVTVGDLVISFSRRKVFRGSAEIKLTPTEYSLLHHLASNAGRVMLHGELLSLVWGPEYRDELEYLRAYIHLLRRKIEVNPASPRIIVSSPGMGYSFDIPRSPEV